MFDKEYFTEYFIDKAPDQGGLGENNHWWGLNFETTQGIPIDFQFMQLQFLMSLHFWY